ncbi:Methyl-accepting chemotaxis protein I (serine chemoreceptor protein) [hydrothermal vent metagenome]|uniref:Methyl-accepting chemotaxis protein I (Serine chemoreceptor protein) n=1 Tax=hydrothermal vent metagenome TaxID=652676 RepID=A0A3B0W2S3_9ZZZZ
MPKLENISIRNKLILLMLFPLIALFYFSSSAIHDRYKAKHQYHEIHTLVEIGILVGNYVHESQKERGMTAGYLGTSGQKFAQELPKQSLVLDREANIFLERVKQINLLQHEDESFTKQLKNVAQRLSQVNEIRQRVLSQNISAKEAIGFFTQLNASSLQLIAYMIHLSSDGQLVRDQSGYLNFLQSKERAGVERAVLTSTFATDKFAPGMDILFSGLVSAQKTYFSVFNSLASDHQIEALQKLLNTPIVKEVDAMRQVALNKIYQGNFGINSSVWFNTITQKIDLLKKMEDSLANELLIESAQRKEAAALELYLYTSGLMLVLLISFILGTKITQNILSQLSKLKRTIENVAQTGEFKHRSNIQGQDEIGQMAQSFDALLQSLNSAIQESNSVITAIKEGDFNQRVQITLKGELHTLKSGINHTAENIDKTMHQLETAINALKAGVFNTQVNTEASGRYRDILNSTKESMQTLNNTVTDVNNVMSAMEQGQFDQRIQAEANGDLDTMKQHVNNAMSTLETAIKDISSVMIAQSSGDLTQTITSQYQGELGVVSEAINHSAIKMNTTLSDISNVAQNVSESVEEIASGSEDLNKRTQQAAATLEETSANMEEITETVKQNTEVAQYANQVATEARDKAVQGSEVAHKAIHSMSDITESSQKILDIIGLIDSIAFQTNLLALNAAVEAARAGEHGRGFAVVASEVRNLAQKSAEASKDIKALIEETVSNVQAGSEFVEQTGGALETINTSIQNVSGMINEISSSSSEQQKGIEHVNNAISNIDTMTQQNSALVEETTAASEALTQQSQALKELIKFFKTETSQEIKRIN